MTRDPRDLLNYRQMHALSKPERVCILAILTERVASPKEIAAELDEPLSQTSYHVRVLRSCELIVEDHKAPRRGAVQHFYRAVSPTLIPPDAWKQLPASIRKGMSTCILQTYFEDATASLKAGIFDKSPGELGWIPFVIDAEGVEELGRLSRDFLAAAIDVQAEATKRLKKSGEKGMSATVFLSTFHSARGPGDGRKASSAKRR